jgi:hypothetical protein
MNTPYTTRTGIKIGARHNESPQPQEIVDMDMLRLQKALIFSDKLLSEDKKDERLFKYFFIGAIILIVVLFIYK